MTYPCKDFYLTNPSLTNPSKPLGTIMTDNIQTLSVQQSQALFLEQINWSSLIPAAIDLFKLIQSGELLSNWERTLAIIKDILESLSLAEQQAMQANPGMQAIDWATILPLILKFLIPILVGIGGKDPIEV